MDELDEPSADCPLPVLEYQNARTQSAAEIRAEGLRGVVIVMAVVWWIASMVAGIASDIIYIPPLKKILITCTGLIIFTLLMNTSRQKKTGCALFFFCLSLLMISVMWFWN